MKRNWEPIKATAIATGSLKEAARLHNVNYNSIKSAAVRYKWPVGQRALQQAQEAQEVANKQIQIATGSAPITTADALAALVQEKHTAYRSSMATTIASAANHAESLTPQKQFAAARKLDSLASAGGKLFGTPDGQVQRLSILAIPKLQRVEGDVIDV